MEEEEKNIALSLTYEQQAELRKKQFEKALDGDVRMLIWLGKQYLGQADSPMNMNINELNEGFDIRVIDSEGEVIEDPRALGYFESLPEDDPRYDWLVKECVLKPKGNKDLPKDHIPVIDTMPKGWKDKK